MATMCWTLRGGRFTSQELMWMWMIHTYALLTCQAKIQLPACAVGG